MDSSFREQGSNTQKAPQELLAGGLRIFASLIHRMAGLISLTEEEQEEAGIYLGRVGGE